MVAQPDPALFARPPPAAKLEPLVGPALARVLYVTVRLGFLLSLITIFPMQAHALELC